MTRYAKPVISGKKQAEEASTWSSLKKTIDTPTDAPKKVKKKKKQKLKEGVEKTMSNDPTITSSKPELNTSSAANNSDDRVVKKLKKKKNKQKLVEEAIKSESTDSHPPTALPTAPHKQGKGSLKFSSMDPALKKNSRADVHRNRRATRNPCFVCRSTRHKASNCPKGSEKGVGVCFKCASTEHTSATCPRRDIKGFPHAKCFICNETGHLSKECPDNPRGLYPNGGCCKECGAVEHFAKDCPSKQRRRKEQNIRLKSMKSPRGNVEENDMMDLEEFIKVRKEQPKPQAHQPKVVKF